MPDAHARPTALYASHYVDVRAPHAANSIAVRLREAGLVTIDGLPSRRELLAFVSRFMAIAPHHHSDPDDLTSIRERASPPRPG